MRLGGTCPCRKFQRQVFHNANFLELEPSATRSFRFFCNITAHALLDILQTHSQNTERKMTTTARVLAVPELVEGILFHLHQRDLLISQRTSRTFRDIVQGSRKLQKTLFFIPDNDKPSKVYGVKLNETDSIPKLPTSLTIAARMTKPAG